MDLAKYRSDRGLSQEDLAKALGLKSKGYISDIEAGKRRASPRLAVRIEKWSEGHVSAERLNPAVAEFRQ